MFSTNQKKNQLWVFVFCLFSLFFPRLIEAKIPDRPHGDYPSDYWQFWFLYESESRYGQRYSFYRPFYSDYTEVQTGYRQETVLFPIYYREKTNYWTTWTVLFFLTGTSSLHEDTGPDDDILLPFYLGGSGGSESDKYWAIFPFYGKIRGKLGYEEINFYLFPLYTNWSRKDYRGHGILWPIIAWGESPTREEFRFFPFYSTRSHEKKYYRKSVLWPFFQWGRIYMDKREPVSYQIFFPFFNYKVSDQGNMKSFGILWFPILGSLAGYGYDKRTREVDFNLLYFLIQFGRNNNDDYRKLILFPFYGQYRFASKQSLFITPLYFQLKSDTFHVKSEYNYLFPFLTFMEQYYPELDRTDKYWKVWPFVRYHRNTEGSLVWNALSLFPVRSEEFEKTWDPITSLVEYQHLSNGEKRFSLLMRLYTQVWSEDKFSLFVPFLTDFTKSKEKTEWKFFYGLVGIKKESNTKEFTLFWFLKI